MDRLSNVQKFEHERVKLIMRAMGNKSRILELQDDCESYGEGRRLTFYGLRKLFPDFPMVLVAQWVGSVNERFPPALLFRSFAETFFLQEYIAVYDRQHKEDGPPIGLVVPFGGFEGGIVIHNADLDTRGTRLVHDIAGDQPPYRVTAEPFVPFIEYLVRDGNWGKLVVHGERVQHGSRILPWMVRAFGTGPAVLVLGWLARLLGSSSGYDRRYVLLREGGEPCVTASHEQIAYETGLNRYQAKRGLKALRKAGLIKPPNRRSPSSIMIDWAAARAFKTRHDPHGIESAPPDGEPEPDLYPDPNTQ